MEFQKLENLNNIDQSIEYFDNTQNQQTMNFNIHLSKIDQINQKLMKTINKINSPTNQSNNNIDDLKTFRQSETFEKQNVETLIQDENLPVEIKEIKNDFDEISNAFANLYDEFLKLSEFYNNSRNRNIKIQRENSLLEADLKIIQIEQSNLLDIQNNLLKNQSNNTKFCNNIIDKKYSKLEQLQTNETMDYNINLSHIQYDNNDKSKLTESFDYDIVNYVQDDIKSFDIKLNKDIQHKENQNFLKRFYENNNKIQSQNNDDIVNQNEGVSTNIGTNRQNLQNQNSEYKGSIISSNKWSLVNEIDFNQSEKLAQIYENELNEIKNLFDQKVKSNLEDTKKLQNVIQLKYEQILIENSNLKDQLLKRYSNNNDINPMIENIIYIDKILNIFINITNFENLSFKDSKVSEIDNDLMKSILKLKNSAEKLKSNMNIFQEIQKIKHQNDVINSLLDLIDIDLNDIKFKKNQNQNSQKEFEKQSSNKDNLDKIKQLIRFQNNNKIDLKLNTNTVNNRKFRSTSIFTTKKDFIGNQSINEIKDKIKNQKLFGLIDMKNLDQRQEKL